jgi:ankyrin repeat protein
MELGDVRQAEQWLDAGLPPDYLGNRIGSGLMIGAWEGKLDLMRLFISRGADIDLLNANGESALALAAWRGQLEAVKWLLERGARINARIASGRRCITPCFPGMARWPTT